MAEIPSLSKRSLDALRQDGVSAFFRQGLLYLLRRIAWRTDEWSKNLDVSILSHRLQREFGPLLKRNEPFRNRHQGKRCFVIGNGPSLKKQDLSLLADEITLVTNSFYVHPIVGDSWQPGYYFLSDPQYFDGTADFTDEFAAISSKIKSAPLFVPSYAHAFLTQSNGLPATRTYYVAVGAVRLEHTNELPDFTTVTPGVQTVVQLAIMAAMFMGCSPIYLLGLDHDWLSHGGEDLHFYSDAEADAQPDGHVGPWTYLSLMGAMTTMWQVYVMLKKVADAAGIEIVNCTHGGFLDVFKRVRYENVVGEKPLTGGASIDS
jgi:hypothetical protein